VKNKSLSYNIEMIKDSLPVPTLVAFEQLKKSNAFDAEYWSARDLQLVLGYTQWRRFEDAIKRAMTSCEESGNDFSNHFANAGKMVGLGSGSERELVDFQLSRFACYPIAQNGDPRKRRSQTHKNISLFRPEGRNFLIR
jgi:DNA-damage-inducible protein D